MTSEPLRCGHPVEPLLDDVARELAGGGGARRDCPVCAAELDALRASWSGVRRTAAVPVPVPPGLVGRAAATVRGLRGRTAGGAVELAGERGSTRLSERALLLLTRTLAAEFSRERGGVHLRGVSVGDDGLHVDVEGRYPAPVADRAEELRSWLAQRLPAHVGERVPAIHLHVVDVRLPAG